MGNTLNSRKNRTILSSCTENTLQLYSSDVYNLAQKLNTCNNILFTLSRLLVKHDGGKLSQVGELSPANRLQGKQGNRQGNPITRVTLALRQGNPTCTRLVNTSCKKRRNVRVQGLPSCQGNPCTGVTLPPCKQGLRHDRKLWGTVCVQ